MTAAKLADQAMRSALIAEVLRRTGNVAPYAVRAIDHIAFTRAKVNPMVTGLFPESERSSILSMLEKSVVFLTGDNIGQVLQQCRLSTAWTLANLYLSSINAPPLSKNAPLIVGLSEETTCYVSHEYFHEQNRFSDFVVHEAAHVFHNCKRFTVGLPETRTKEFLLNIDFHQRETFAYACEVYSRILELSPARKDRIRLLEDVRQTFTPPDDKVDIEKFQSALQAAVASKNGWQKILKICAPQKRPRQTFLAPQPQSASF